MCMNEFMAVSIKHGLQTGYKIRTIKYGLVKCMVNKGASFSSSS